MVLCGSSPSKERNPGTNVPYTSSVSRIRSGRLFLTRSAILPMVSLLSAMPVGLPGFTTKNALIFGSSSFLISSSVGWNRFSWGARDVDHVQVIILEMRHFDIRREDRCAQRDRVARMQQPIRFQRFEDVAHRGRAALDRIEVELAGGPRISAHRPHQVFVRDALVVDSMRSGTG